MKTLKSTLVIIAVAALFVACKDGKKEIAQKQVESYVAYIDSVSNVTSEKAIENLETIESNYQKMKTDVTNSIVSVKENSELQTDIDEATLKYETYKAEVMAEHERMKVEKFKMNMRKTLLGNEYSGGDMDFLWINKDNILGVYQNFVDTVDKNKDTYSREDWDEIKLLYEAIDTRKNTVENEGLSRADNNKIAALKLKFAPMYTLHRMGAKSEENAESKQ